METLKTYFTSRGYSQEDIQNGMLYDLAALPKEHSVTSGELLCGIALNAAEKCDFAAINKLMFTGARPSVEHEKPADPVMILDRWRNNKQPEALQAVLLPYPMLKCYLAKQVYDMLKKTESKPDASFGYKVGRLGLYLGGSWIEDRHDAMRLEGLAKALVIGHIIEKELTFAEDGIGGTLAETKELKKIVKSVLNNPHSVERFDMPEKQELQSTETSLCMKLEKSPVFKDLRRTMRVKPKTQDLGVL
jgi:hypothetical protein